VTAVSHLLGFLILFAGCGLAAVAGLLARDDIRAREWEHRNARRWEGNP
jgi:hypothetical protein